MRDIFAHYNSLDSKFLVETANILWDFVEQNLFSGDPASDYVAERDMMYYLTGWNND